MVEITYDPSDFYPSPVNVYKGTTIFNFGTLLDGDLEYQFFVKTIDENGNKSTGTSVILSPNEVSGITAEWTGAGASITWTEPVYQGLEKVSISFTPSESGVTQPVEIVQGITSCIIPGLNDQTSYSFNIKSVYPDDITTQGNSITLAIRDIPSITFSTNGGYVQNVSTAVTVDDSSITIASLTYQWTNTSDFPSGGSWTTFTNGDTISLAVEDQHWFLHIIVTDDKDNITQASSSEFIKTTCTDISDSLYEGFNDIAIDSTDKVHICYFYNHDPSYDLMYTSNSSGSWSTEVIDNSTTYRVGRNNSMIIDDSDNIHIAYQEGISGCLKYATNSSGSWVVSFADSSPSFDNATSIGLDSSNKVHISYYDYGNAQLKYATNSSGTWVTKTFTGSNIGSANCIGILSNDQVLIAFSEDSDYDLRYNNTSTTVPGTWETNKLIETAGGYIRSMIVDSSDSLHISYYNTSSKDLKYATNSSGSWVTATLESDDSVGFYSSIAIDNNEYIHIAYYKSTGGDLKYATNTSGTWEYSVLDSTGTVGKYPSIAVDSNNHVHICYYDETNYKIKYITW